MSAAVATWGWRGEMNEGRLEKIVQVLLARGGEGKISEIADDMKWSNNTVDELLLRLAARRMVLADKRRGGMFVLTEEARTMAVATAAVHEVVSVVLVHGDETFLRRNNIVRKLQEFGVRILDVREVKGSKPRTDLPSEADAVVIVGDRVEREAVRAFKDRAESEGKRCWVLAHNSTHTSWTPFRAWVFDEHKVARRTPAPVITIQAKLETVPEQQPQQPQQAEPAVASDRPLQPAEVKVLEDLWQEQIRGAKAEAAKVRLQYDVACKEIERLKASSGAQARDQLATDLARKEQERREAVRRAHEVQQELTARLEAAERERREAEQQAKHQIATLREAVNATNPAIESLTKERDETREHLRMLMEERDALRLRYEEQIAAQRAELYELQTRLVLTKGSEGNAPCDAEVVARSLAPLVDRGLMTAEAAFAAVAKAIKG